MNEIISAAVLLILIMDPLGNLPIFMSVLKHTEPKRRRAIMVRELLIALLVMLVFLFAGEKILAFLSLRAETVSISGGIILFLIAIKMIFPSASGNSSGLPAGEEPFIVPLAIPLVAGPTILATLMLLSHQYPNQMGHLVIALLLAWGGDAGGVQDLLINLDSRVPAFFERFARIAEVVNQEPLTRQALRDSYRFYRQRGYAPQHLHL